MEAKGFHAKATAQHFWYAERILFFIRSAGLNINRPTVKNRFFFFFLFMFEVPALVFAYVLDSIVYRKRSYWITWKELAKNVDRDEMERWKAWEWSLYRGTEAIKQKIDCTPTPIRLCVYTRRSTTRLFENLR